MRVTRIDIFGFKSFMEKLSLPLTGGVTAIVGPNGCGKSNIVDAIRWVLGETRIKNLRGGTLEDVIFNGTSNLRPLGLAEVTITLSGDKEDFISQIDTTAVEVQMLEEGEVEENADLSEAMETRYSWLKSATELQITRRLFRSGESEFFVNQVPCRLRDLKEICNAVGLAVKGFTIVAQGEVSKIVTSKPEVRRQYLEEAAGVQGFKDKISTTERRLEEATVNIARIDDVLKEVSRQVGSLKRQANRALNRQTLKDEILELDTMLFKHRIFSLTNKLKDIEEKLKNSNNQEQEFSKSYDDNKAQEEQFRAQLLNLDVNGDELRRNLDTAREELNTVIRDRAQKQAKFDSVKAYAESQEREYLNQSERLKVLEARKKDFDNSVNFSTKERDQLQEQLKTIDTDNSKLTQLNSQLDALRKELREIDSKYQNLSNQMAGKKASLNSAREQLIAASPTKVLKDSINQFSDTKLLIDGIKVPAAYVTAVQSALSEKSAYLIGEAPHKVAKLFSQHKSSRGLGIIKFGTAERKNHDLPFKCLLDLIEVNEGYQSAIYSWLENFYLVDKNDAAFDYFEKNPESKISLVTLDGEIVTANSFFVFRHEAGMVHIKTKADTLEAELTNIQNEFNQINQKRTELNTQVTALQNEIAQQRYNLEQRQSKAREISNKIASLNGKIVAEANNQKQINFDLERIQNTIATIQSKQEQYKTELEQATTALQGLDLNVEKECKDRLVRVNTEYQALENNRKNLRNELNSFVAKSENSRKELDKIRLQVNNWNLDQQKLSLELENYNQRFIDDFSEEYCKSLTFTEENLLDEAKRNECQSKVRSLRERIQREGDIDPESIQRHEEEAKREAELTGQKNDLEKAAVTLKSTLERLVKTSEIRFMETFAKVQENFGNLVPKLFGGGKGSIELSHPNDPLNSGLEIIARPPGKKLKNIELLSGGEKAMCATALIMAMFMVRPSPLCILDEVDAPLDEANLVRFLTVIREMSNQTQFLVITHNKASMQVADNLVGVTMEQPGASKLISVSLNEAVSQMAM